MPKWLNVIPLYAIDKVSKVAHTMPFWNNAEIWDNHSADLECSNVQPYMKNVNISVAFENTKFIYSFFITKQISYFTTQVLKHWSAL